MSDLYLETLGTGPALILLHGWGWHSGIWKPLVPLLSEHYQLFLIDLPGFGHSRVLPTDYTFAAIAKQILALVPESATWLGWSLGGMVAWWVAIHHPARINKLITVASTPRFVSDSHWPGVPADTLEKFSTTLLTDYQQTITDFLELQLRGSANASELFLQLKTELFATPQPSAAALLGGLQLLRDSDLRRDFSKIKCPSLHVFGSHDALVPAKIAVNIQAELPLGKCEVIKRAGHMPFLTQPEIFTSLLLTRCRVG